MLSKLFDFFNTAKIKYNIRKIAKYADSLIYSEKYNLSEESEHSRFKEEIEHKCGSGTNLLQAYIVLNHTTYHRIAIEDVNMELLVAEIMNAVSKPKDDKLISLLIKVEEAKLAANLLIMDLYLNAGKKAFDENEYSYRGIIYKAERANKGTLKKKDEESIKILSNDLSELESQSDRHKNKINGNKEN